MGRGWGGPGFCGLGAGGRGGERVSVTSLPVPVRPAAAGSSELLAAGLCWARKSGLGPLLGGSGDCHSPFPGFPVFTGLSRPVAVGAAP